MTTTAKSPGRCIGEFIGHAIRYTIDFYKDFFTRIKDISVPDFSSRFVSVLLVNLAFAAYNYLRSGNGNIYMSVFLPYLFVNTVIVLLSCIYKSSHLFTILTSMLLTIGSGLQTYMISPDSENAMSEVIKLAAVQLTGIICSILALPVLSLITSGKISLKAVRLILFGVTVMCYLLLLVAGREINGTRAWLYIGSLSLQITEISKLLAIIHLSLFVIDSKLTDKIKMRDSLIMLLVHCAFLVVINELGTAVILGIIFFLQRILFYPDRKKIATEILALFLLGCVLIAGLFGISKIELPDTNNTAAEETAITEQTSGTENQEMSEQTEAPVSSSSQKKEDSVALTYLRRIQRIYPKLEKRVCVFLGIGDITADDTYQTDMAKKALRYADLFGTSKGSLASVPEISSDFVFIYVIVRLGLIPMIIILLTLIFIFGDTLIYAARTTRKNEMVIAATFICTIIFQSFICMLSNVGLFPVIGLPMPFISSGGTSTVVTLLMTTFIMYFMRKNTENKGKEVVRK